METLGSRIKNLRKQAGISQEEFAEKLQVSRQTVTRWEQDAIIPKTHNLVKMCELFSMPLSYFVGENESAVVPTVNSSETSVTEESVAALDFTVCENIRIVDISEDTAPKPKNRKNIILLITVPVLLVIAAILAFIGYLYAPDEGAADTVHSGTFNFDDIGTLLWIIAGIILFICIVIIVVLIINKIKNRRKRRK